MDGSVVNLPMDFSVSSLKDRATWFSPGPKWPFTSWRFFNGGNPFTTYVRPGMILQAVSIHLNECLVKHSFFFFFPDRTLLAFGILSFRRPLGCADRTSECARPSMVTKYRASQTTTQVGCVFLVNEDGWEIRLSWYGLNFLEPNVAPEKMVG